MMVGCVGTKWLFGQWYARKHPATTAESKAAVERATLGTYTGTSVTELRKTKIGEAYRVTVHFDYELTPGTTRSTYVVVEDETGCDFAFKAKVITAIKKVVKESRA